MKNLFNEMLFRRIMAMLLCVCMVLPLCLTTGSATELAGSGTVVNTQENQTEQNAATTKDTYYVVAGSDFQANTDTLSAEQVTNILTQVKNNYSTMDGFLFCGDYSAGTGSATSVDALKGAVDSVYPGLSDNGVYVQGNHDPTDMVKDGIISAGGANDAEGYGVYVINEDDFPWYDYSTSNRTSAATKTLVQNTANALASYLNAKVREQYTKPIFVVSHVPLHYTMRTRVYRDNVFAKTIFDVLNEAGADGLNIIFMYGHNHSNTWEDSHGGSAVYYPKGSDIKISGTDASNPTDEVLNFTYMNAGYVGYYSYSYTYEGTTAYNSDVETTLTMSVFEITDDTVKVVRYSADGKFANLKSAGVENTAFSYTSGGTAYTEASMPLVGGCTSMTPRTNVITGPQTITLNKEIDPAEGVESNVLVEVDGVAIPAIATKCVSTIPSGYTFYTAYDFDVYHYTPGTKAVVTLAVDGIDATKPVFVIDGESNEILPATYKNGNVIFETSHFSLYTVAQASVSSYSGSSTATDMYNRVTAVESGNSYVLVSYVNGKSVTPTKSKQYELADFGTIGVNFYFGMEMSDAPIPEATKWSFDGTALYADGNTSNPLGLSNWQVFVGSGATTNRRTGDIFLNDDGKTFTVHRPSSDWYLMYINVEGVDYAASRGYSQDTPGPDDHKWYFYKQVSGDTAVTLTVTPAKEVLMVGDAVELMTVVKAGDIDSEHYDITYTSSNQDVAVVDDNGMVTAKSGGRVMMTVKLTAVNGTTLNAPIEIQVPLVVQHLTKNNIVITRTGFLSKSLVKVNGDEIKLNTPYVIANYNANEAGGYAVLSNISKTVGSNTGLELVPELNADHIWYYDGSHLRYGAATGEDNYLLFDPSTNKVAVGSGTAAQTKVTINRDTRYGYSAAFFRAVLGENAYHLNYYGGAANRLAYMWGIGGDGTGNLWTFYEVKPAEVDFTISYPKSVMKVGEQFRAVATVYCDGEYVNTSNCTIEWAAKGSNITVSTSGSGKVTGVNVGYDAIIATLTHVKGVALDTPITIEGFVSVEANPENTNSVTVSGNVGNLLTTEKLTLTPGTPMGPFVISNKQYGSVLTGRYISRSDPDWNSKYDYVEGLSVEYNQGAKHIWYYDGAYMRYGTPNGTNNYLAHDGTTNQDHILLGTIDDYKFDTFEAVTAGTGEDGYYIKGSNIVNSEGRYYIQHYGSPNYNIASFYKVNYTNCQWYLYKAIKDANATLTVYPSNSILSPGDNMTLWELVRLEGEKTTTYAITYTSSDTSVATVTATGSVTAVSGGHVSITATVTAINGMTLPFPLQVSVPLQVAVVNSTSGSSTLTFEQDSVKKVDALVPGSGPYIITNYFSGFQLSGNMMEKGNPWYFGWEGKEGLELLKSVDNGQVWYYDEAGYFRFGNLTDTDNYLIFKDDKVMLGTKAEGEPYNHVVPYNGYFGIGYGYETTDDYAKRQFLNHYGGGVANAAHNFTFGTMEVDADTNEETLVCGDTGSLWGIYQVSPATEVVLKVEPDLTNLRPWDTVDMTATLTAAGVSVSNYSLSWEVADTTVASYAGGKLTALKGGDTTLNVTLNAYNGVALTQPVTMKIPVHVKSVASITLTADRGQVMQRSRSGANVVVDVKNNTNRQNVYLNVLFEGEITPVAVPITLGMLTNAEGKLVDTEEVTDETDGIDTYENLTITYGGATYSGFTLDVVAPTGEENPPYPNEGSVQVDKTGTGISFTSTGVAQIELSTTGVPVRTGVDVIIMLDTSGSMGNRIEASGNMRRREVMTNSLNSLINTLQQPDASGQKMDIRVAVADFNNYFDETDSPYYFEPTDTVRGYNTDGNVAIGPAWVDRGGLGPEVYTGSKKIDVDAFVPVHDIGTFTVDQFDGKNGTNYDYAFDVVYHLGEAITSTYTGGEDRDLVVIFMSDGAPFQYNYFTCRSNNVSWNNWITGNMDVTMEGQTALAGSMFPDGVNKHYYNEDGKHWMAEAIKGKTSETYPVLRNETGERDENGFLRYTGLGATMYSIGFCLATDGVIEVPSMETVLKNIATSSDDDKYYFKVDTADQLDACFESIAGDIMYSATNAFFVDTMGPEFNLQMASTVTGENNTSIALSGFGITPAIEFRSYTIYTPQDAKDGLCDIAQIGTRKTDEAGNYIYTVLEKVTFNAAGTQAYSDKVDVNGDGVCNTSDNILVNGVINASTFWYNTKATAVTIAHDINRDGTASDSLPAETFCWKVGTISTKELVLSYHVYLEGSMEGERAGGVYDTNASAILYYTNYLGHKSQQEVPTPKLPWEQASVGYAFYLVNEKGEPLLPDGTVGSFLHSQEITQPVINYFLLNSGEQDLLPQKLIEANDVLPDGYTLFDPNASYSVSLASDGSGTFVITTGDTSLPNTTYVEGLRNEDLNKDLAKKFFNDPTMSNSDKTATFTTDDGSYITANTIVWFAVKATISAVPDTVVIDYGLTTMIDVTANDIMSGGTGTLTYVNQAKVFTDTDEYKTWKAANPDKALWEYLHEMGATATSPCAPVGTDSSGNAYTALSRRSGSYGDIKLETNTDGLTTGRVEHRVWSNIMTMNKEDTFVYATYYNGSVSSKVGYHHSTITVIPATTLYVEDNKGGITYTVYKGDPNGTEGDKVTTEAEWTTKSGGAQQDQDRPGEFTMEGFDANNVYGYDSHYANRTTYSLGSYHAFTSYMDGNEVVYGTAEFTFTGTGFDVISMTSNTSGTITACVYDYSTYKAAKVAGAPVPADTEMVAAFLVDTYYGYTYDSETGEWSEAPGSNTSNTAGEVNSNKLYQVPVLNVAGLDYGKYTVVLTIAYTDLFDHGQNGSYDFYLDAIRIYDPANDGDGNKVIENAYKADKEGWPEYFELRNLIIGAKDFNADASATTVPGAVFIDGIKKSKTPTIADYISYGPNNELYLAPGQAIAFELNMGGPVASVQLGVKSVGGTSTAKCYLLGDEATNVLPATIATATDMYYNITALNGLDKNDEAKVVVIRNESTSAAILSITNIKVTYTESYVQPTPQILSISKNKVENVLAALAASVGEEDAGEVVNGVIDVTGASLSFEDEILTNLYYTVSDLEATEMGLLTWASLPEDGTMDNAENVYVGATYDADKDRYMVQTAGIAAKNLGDDIYMRVYAKTANGIVYSDVVTYSPKQYAMSRLEKSTNETMKALCVAMLNYGAAAQEYFGYKTDALVNADLTAEQQALVCAYDASLFAGTVKADEAKIGAFVTTETGFSKKNASVSFDGAFAINYYFTANAEVAGDMTFYYWTADAYANAETLTAENASGTATMVAANGVYWAQVSGIAAKQLDETYYVAAVYADAAGNTYCTGVVAYSLSAYCVKNAVDGNAMKGLAEATAIYGYYAKQYFG